VGAENLCRQVIFVEDAASPVTPLDPEMIQVSNAAGQGAERRGLVQGAVRPVRAVKSSYSRSTIIRWRWFQIRVRPSSSRRQLPIHRSMTGSIHDDDADPPADQVGYQQRGVWLTRDELLGMITGLRHAIAPLLDNPATPDRTRYLVSPILFPAEKPSPS
jgi:hypothetical protein